MITTPTGVGGRATRRLRDLASRLYHGEAGIDVVGKRRYFYGVAAAILLIGLVTVFVRPFNIGIEFKGGNSFTVPASVGTLEQVRGAVVDTGADVASAQRIGGSSGDSYLIKVPTLDPDASVNNAKALQIRDQVAARFGIDPSVISEEQVSGTWGGSVTKQAIIGTVVFLVLVVVYLSAVFREWKMAVAALAALFQNLILTATVYLLVGFEVSPATVIGFLTILGFALYDVVVVFDKVRENTRGITGNPNRTYGEAANLAVNQTLMRSINTGIVALLPVGGLLFVGAFILRAGTLKDLGLVLFIGMLAAVYSSIFFATPVLVDLKEAEPTFKQHKARVLARRASGEPERRQKALRPVAPGAGARAARPQPGAAAAGRTAGTGRTPGTGRAAGTPRAAAPTSRDVPPTDVPEEETDLNLAGTAPRPGARPAPRKRTGGKSGGRPGARGGRRR
ncbi:MAG TPA: protein translocase subunit SecF [Micromonosporaceae bacterium]